MAKLRQKSPAAAAAAAAAATRPYLRSGQLACRRTWSPQYFHTAKNEDPAAGLVHLEQIKRPACPLRTPAVLQRQESQDELATPGGPAVLVKRRQ